MRRLESLISRAVLGTIKDSIKKRIATTIPIATRIFLYPVVQLLLDRKLQYLRKSNGRIEVASERNLRATKWYYLSGFEAKDDHRSEEFQETSLSVFLKMFKFQDAHDNDGGWTPLRCAVQSQNEQIVRQLLELGVDVNAPYPDNLDSF